MLTSYDIELDAVGASTPEVYVLARDASGAPSLQLGDMPNEPGTAAEINTIQIPNFTGGFGQLLDADPTKYLYQFSVVATQPTHMAAKTEGSSTDRTIIDAFESATSNSTGAASYVPVSDTLWFLVTPQFIWSFNPRTGGTYADTTADIGYSLASTEYFTGSWAKHGTDIYFGVANSSHVSQNMCFWPISTSATTGWGEVAGAQASHMYSFGDKIWWVENKGAAPHEAYWTDTDLNSSPTIRGPFNIQSENRVTSIHILGAYLIYFLSDGTINGIDVDGVFAPLVTDSVLSTSGQDDLFGFGAIDYSGGLIVPSATGLHYLTVGSISNISIYKFNPWQNDVMHTILTSIGFGVKCIASSEEEIFLGTDGGATPILSILFHGIQIEPDRFAFHPIKTGSASSPDEVRAIAVYTDPSSLQRLIHYVFDDDGVDDGIATHLTYPDPSLSSDTGVDSANGLIRTSLLGMAQGGTTKRFIRVRGHLQSESTIDFGVGFKVDGIGDEAATSMGTFKTAQGLWNFDFPTTSASLGRTVQLEFNLNGFEMVQFPIYIDYEMVPSKDDFISLTLVASPTPEGKQGVHSRKVATRDTIVDAISALKGGHATLKFRDTSKTWTVVVEGYEAVDSADDIVLNRGESAVKVLCRRIA